MISYSYDDINAIRTDALVVFFYLTFADGIYRQIFVCIA